ncbi:MAG: coenzyme F420-0:L-glutamate ligase [Pseudomonadota bacterium]
MIAGVTLLALHGLPEVRQGDDLAALIAGSLNAMDVTLKPGDVISVAHKVVSKAEGRVRRLDDVKPSDEALRYAQDLSKDARKVQVVLDESIAVLRAFKHPQASEGTMICQHHLGLISANAGVDESNTAEEGDLILLPQNPDRSAAELRSALEDRFGGPLGVVITDTFGRPWRLGQVNVAIGVSGVPARKSDIGDTDARGQVLRVTEPAFADEIAAASGLVIGKAAKTPVVIFQGLAWQPDEAARASHLIRAQGEDMFR